MKATSEELQLAEELLSDGNQDSWEQGRLGRDFEHARKLSDTETEKYLGDKKGTSIRLPPVLIEDLKTLAMQKGLNYQAYLRMILIEHVRSKKTA
jgi:predicted DNA binding CopG/RHH family protein